MGHPTNLTLAQEFAASLDWWRGAGVEHDFADDATDWLDKPAETKTAPSQAFKPKSSIRIVAPPEPIKKLGGDKANWPTDLTEFQSWFTASTDIDDGGAYPAIPPRGQAKPKLMVIVPEPEANDRDALLSGASGNLLSGMMRAAGIDADSLYVASALRRHTPLPDWPELAGAGLGELLAHHINLVAPERILSFGRNIPALLGNDTAQGAAILHNFNHEGGSIPAMGASSLAELLRSAGRRKRFWQNWLDWTDG